MLGLPDAGLSRSVKQHNIDSGVLCDWIEANAVFGDGQLSKSEVVDALIQHEIYENRDFALEIVDEAWSVVSDRIKYLREPLGIKWSGNRISRTDAWVDFPAYGFCLALACAALYPTWAQKQWGSTWSVPGELFEELAQESFSNALPGWTVRRIGWSPASPTKLRDSIQYIIGELNEVPGSELEVHVDSKANELGLDLLAYCSFGDSHASFPVLLVQCATGKNWKSKRQSPDISVWKTIVSFHSNPIRAFAIPFTFANSKEFRKQSKSVDGVFVDRNRLIGSFQRRTIDVSQALNEKLIAWLTPCIRTMPRDND